MNKKKHLCALFDLDGVIVDTAKFHFLAWKKIAKNIGYELTHEDNEQLKGVSRQDSLNIILDLANVTIDLEVFNHYLLQKNNDYLLLIQSISPNDILPGISEALTFLKEYLNSSYLLCAYNPAFSASFYSKNSDFGR